MAHLRRRTQTPPAISVPDRIGETSRLAFDYPAIGGLF
jgi:hypothetical protein